MSILAAAAVPHPPILLPEVGHGEESKIRKTAEAYRQAMLALAALRPDTVVLTSPHAVMYSDYFHVSPGGGAKGDMGGFRAPGVRFEALYDTEFADQLEKIAQNENFPAGALGERNRTLDHGTMVPLYYLNKLYADYKLVRIGLSGLPARDHYRLGQLIARTAEGLGRRTVLVASGDLSHKLLEHGSYGFAPEGPEFDRQAVRALAEGDFLALLSVAPDFADAAGECGLRSLQIMAGTLDRKAVTHELLSYEGPFGVGYAVALFEVKGDDPGRNIGDRYEAMQKKRHDEQVAGEDAYVRLARLGLETYVRTGKRASLPDTLPPELLHTRAGAFVSLKKHGRLRGCIGTISAATDSIAQEILQNAVSAAVDDPRFDPVTPDELHELVYSVDVLGETEEIASPAMLDVRRYGVIVQRGGRRGLLLPNLEGVNTVEEQIAIARQKAGIPEGETVRLFRFEVVRHQ